MSVEDIKLTLGNIGGGVKEVHIMSQGKSGQGLQAKVSFVRPAEGGRDCIARFDGIVADGISFIGANKGRMISVAFETSSGQTHSTSFLNHRADPEQTTIATSLGGQRHGRKKPQGQNNAPTARMATPDGHLYSDAIVMNNGRKR